MQQFFTQDTGVVRERDSRAMVTIEQVDLQRYDIAGLLGTGADYQARAAIDRATGKQVVLKRPVRKENNTSCSVSKAWWTRVVF